MKKRGDRVGKTLTGFTITALFAAIIPTIGNAAASVRAKNTTAAVPSASAARSASAHIPSRTVGAARASSASAARSATPAARLSASKLLNTAGKTGIAASPGFGGGSVGGGNIDLSGLATEAQLDSVEQRLENRIDLLDLVKSDAADVYTKDEVDALVASGGGGGVPGPQGEKGEKGDPGEQGPQGEKGDPGDMTSLAEWAQQPNKPAYNYSEIIGVPMFAPIAFSGSYYDLDDAPSIPSIDGLATEDYVISAVAAAGSGLPPAGDGDGMYLINVGGGASTLQKVILADVYGQ